MCDLRIVVSSSAAAVGAIDVVPKGIGIADKKLLQAHTKADHRNPSGPDAA